MNNKPKGYEMDYLIEAWACGCLTDEEFGQEAYDLANFEALQKSENDAEGAWLRVREFDIEADMDEAVWL